MTRGARRRLGHAIVLLVAALVLAMIAVVAAPLGRQPAGEPDDPDPTATPPIPTLAPTPEPVTVEPALVNLAAIAWWDLGPYGFGASSEPWERLRVGTLDGRLVADLALSAGAFAAGPYDSHVLAGHDDGTISEVFLVSALDGTRRQVLLADGIVPVASLGADGSVYFVRVDRASGEDVGLWRLPGGGAQQQLVVGPLAGEPLNGDDPDATLTWRMAWAPDATTLALQACRGVRCWTYLVDTAAPVARARRVPVLHPVGPMIGVTDGELLARGTLEVLGDIVAVDLATLDWRTAMPDTPDAVLIRIAATWALAAEDGGGGIRIQPVTGPPRPWMVPPGSATAPVLPASGVGGVDAPNGWVLRWSVVVSGAWDDGALVNVVRGEEISVPAPVAVVTRPECPFVPPAELPSGAAPGPMVESVEGGVHYARWSRGPDRVIQATGAWMVGSPDELPADEPHEVRGQPAKIVFIGDESTGEIALVWEEGGCPYTVWLAPGTFFVDAEDYARRY